MRIYRQLSEQYTASFNKNILEFNKKAMNHDKTNVAEYSMFYPVFGASETVQKTILVYGQAVLDWKEKFTIQESKEIIKKKVDKSIIYSNDYYEEDKHNPLDWVNVHWSKAMYDEYVTSVKSKEFYQKIEYMAYRSFFWNVIYKLAADYSKVSRNSREWSEHVIWSNLYKITGGRRNPNSLELKWQEALSCDLLKKELDEIKPAICLVLTNDSWWEPFRKYLGTTKINVNGIIESIEKYGDTDIIVTSRPFGGSSDEHVKQIMNVIDANRTN